jgi:hypothetical protein
MLRLICVLLLVAPIIPAFQQDTTSSDSERDKDVYAIYSLMLSKAHPTALNERYLMASTTVPGYPEIPCVQPPIERNGDFREVLADYERRKTIQRQLKPMFSLPKPYVFLTGDEVNKVMQEQGYVSRRGEKPPDERFRGVTDIFLLSDVYFNPRRTIALTAIFSWCGGLCGERSWVVFEKLDGKWKQLPWVKCFVVS